MLPYALLSAPGALASVRVLALARRAGWSGNRDTVLAAVGPLAPSPVHDGEIALEGDNLDAALLQGRALFDLTTSVPAPHEVWGFALIVGEHLLGWEDRRRPYVLTRDRPRLAVPCRYLCLRG